MFKKMFLSILGLAICSIISAGSFITMGIILIKSFLGPITDVSAYLVVSLGIAGVIGLVGAIFFGIKKDKTYIDAINRMAGPGKNDVIDNIFLGKEQKKDG